MKQMLRKWLSAALAVCMLFSVSVTTAFAADEGTNAAPGGGEQGGGSSSSYTLTVSADKTTVTAGGTVTLTATVTKDGTEVTDLSSAGLYLWWWTDQWTNTGGNTDATYSDYDDDSGLSLTATVTLPTVGTYYIAANLQNSNKEDVDCDYVYTTITVEEASTSTDTLTATLDKYTTTVGGSFTITFSQSLSGSVYYKIQVISTAVEDDNWDSYSGGYAVNGTTQEGSYSISGLSAGTYYIYVGYSGDWSELIPGSTVLTVMEDGVDDITGYYLGITLDSDKDTNSANAGNDDYNPIYVYNGTDTVNVTVTLYDGDGQVPDSFPSGYQIYVWFEDKYETDDDYENPLVEASTNVTTTGKIALSGGSYTFETGTTYNVYARIEYTDYTEINGTMVSTSFTINTTYGITGYINSSSTAGQVFNLGNTITVSPTYTTYVNGTDTTENNKTIPTGTMMTIYYKDDTGTWYDPVYSYGTRVRANGSGVSDSQSGTITLSAGNFTPGQTYTIYYELYNEGGETLAVTSLTLEINKPKFYTRTLTLDGGIGLNYYVNDNGVGTSGTGSLAYYTVVFTIAKNDYQTSEDDSDRQQTAEFVPTSYRNDLDDTGNSYYRFTGYVSSVEIGTSVTADLVYTYKGESTTVQSNTYKVSTYCTKAISGSWVEADLCNALLNYGYYAQVNFEMNDGEGEGVSSENFTSVISSVSASTVSKYELSDTNGVLGDSDEMGLSLDSLNLLTLYTSTEFNSTADVANSETTTAKVYTIDDGEKDGVYVRVPAYLLNNTYTFTTSGGSTVECSALSYVYEVLSDESSEVKLQNICKAIYCLAEEADAYTSADGWYTGNT